MEISSGEYYKILEETTKPFVKKHSAFIERNQKSKCLLDKVGLFVSLTTDRQQPKTGRRWKLHNSFFVVFFF